MSFPGIKEDGRHGIIKLQDNDIMVLYGDTMEIWRDEKMIHKSKAISIKKVIGGEIQMNDSDCKLHSISGSTVSQTY